MGFQLRFQPWEGNKSGCCLALLPFSKGFRPASIYLLLWDTRPWISSRADCKAEFNNSNNNGNRLVKPSLSRKAWFCTQMDSQGSRMHVVSSAKPANSGEPIHAEHKPTLNKEHSGLIPAVPWLQAPIAGEGSCNSETQDAEEFRVEISVAPRATKNMVPKGLLLAYFSAQSSTSQWPARSFLKTWWLLTPSTGL